MSRALARRPAGSVGTLTTAGRLMRRAPVTIIGLAAALALAGAPPAAAQATWTGAISGIWGNSGNWSPATIPPAGINQALTFGAAANTAMNVGNGGFAYVLNQMTFSAGGPAYTCGGNPLDFHT